MLWNDRYVMKTRLRLLVLTLLLLLAPTGVRAGDFERLYFDGIAGTPMLNLRNSINGTPTDPNDALYPDFPVGASMAEVVTTGIRRVELAGTSPDNFATLIRAYVQAPMDGAYKFYIASDDSSEFYISADHTPLDIRAAGNFLSATPAPKAFETGCCTALFSGDRLEDRTTDPITLQKGKLYYIELYEKEGGGGAWVELGWQRPDGVQERIPAALIFPFVFPESANFATVSGVTAAPADVTVTEVQAATFSVSGVFDPTVTFQWLENGSVIPGATLATYSIPQTTLAMSGRKYSVNVNGTATAEATLIVNADPTAPTIVSAIGSGLPHGIIVTFSKPVDQTTATAIANYSFTGQTLTISGIEMLAPDKVLLKVANFNTTPFSVVINNVKDRTTAGNVIAANSTANVNLAMPQLAIAHLFTGLSRETGTASFQVQRTRDLPSYPNGDWSGPINGIDVPQTGPGFGPGTDLSDFQTFVRGYIVAPESGDFQLFIRSDDPGAFYLSTDDSFANLPAVDAPTMWQDGCCNALGAAGNGLDATVTFVAGKLYAFEAYAAEYGGGDYLQIGWATPSDSTVRVIPLSAVATDAASGALTISQQPVSKTVLQNTAATFSVTVTGSDPSVIQYQWYRGGQPIAGATGSSYTLNAVQTTDTGAKFTVRASNKNGTFNELVSNEATLTVSTDNLAPQVTKIFGSRTYNKVNITFDEPVDPVTATTIGNYTVAGLQISAATLSADGRTVTLTTATQAPRTRYDVTVNGVADIISANNKISNFQGNFLSFDIGRGWVTFEYFANIAGNPVDNLINAAKFPNSPDAVLLLNSFNTPNGYAEAYGARISGWFYPPVTGDYRFFIRSDDASRLYFNPAGAAEVSALTGGTPIAEETSCCGAFMDPGSPETSEVFALTKDVPYYIEALLKEGGGGDWLQVAYRLETDTTPAASLQPIPGSLLGTLLDVDVNLQITQQPTDQLGVVPSQGIPFKVEDFNTTDGSFTVETVGDVVGPWVYDSAAGNWRADNGNDGCGTPQNSALITPELTLAQSGALTLSFNHRYSFEPEYDGGQVRISVNGGAFTTVPPENFRQNGYATALIVGTGIMNNRRAFNGNSAGYAAGDFVTSVASLGTFKQGDKIMVEFIAAWDECSIGTVPNWVVDSMRIDLLPMIIQDFAANNGNYTVETVGTVPEPWAYNATEGAWVANSGNDACGTPGNSSLKSPAYTVPQDDEVTLSFRHRYSFEGDYWDGGQVRISVNGGPFTAVAADKFIANGYQAGTIQGTGILNGQRAFNGDSAGYAAGTLITSSAVLGSFKQGDTIVVAFVGAWDECSRASVPSWVVKDLSLSFGKAAQASTFTVAGTATLHGDPLTLSYQWQRNDGAGFVDIAGANSASFTLYPTAADLTATFRVIVSAPGASVTSSTAKLTGSAPPPTIGVALVNGLPSITFTGRLQSATTVNGTYNDVQNATNPYPVPAGQQMLFFRSVR
jgi:hypothetical protein